MPEDEVEWLRSALCSYIAQQEEYAIINAEVPEEEWEEHNIFSDNPLIADKAWTMMREEFNARDRLQSKIISYLEKNFYICCMFAQCWAVKP